MRIEPEIGGAGIVLSGDFNPAIYTPAWFALNGLLPKHAADGAKMEIVHPQMTVFGFDWLRLTASPDHFECEISRAPLVRVQDFVVRVFREHLRHTPLKAFEITRQVHFRVRTPTERDRIGRKLAPVEPWGVWREKLGLDSDYGGLASLTMSQNCPDDRPEGDRIGVTVEPSFRIDDRRTGVYVRVIDHYTTGDASPGNAEHLMDVLENNFEDSLKRSEYLIDHVMSLATE